MRSSQACETTKQTIFLVNYDVSATSPQSTHCRKASKKASFLRVFNRKRTDWLMSRGRLEGEGPLHLSRNSSVFHITAHHWASVFATPLAQGGPEPQIAGIQLSRTRAPVSSHRFTAFFTTTSNWEVRPGRIRFEPTPHHAPESKTLRKCQATPSNKF